MTILTALAGIAAVAIGIIAVTTAYPEAPSRDITLLIIGGVALFVLMPISVYILRRD